MVSRKPSRILCLFLLAAVPARAADQDITGVQPAALDQPRIYMLLRRAPAGPPLAAKGDKGLAGLLDMLTGGVDVAGMPAMANRVVVIDPKPLNSFADKLRTAVLPPNDASIPKTVCHIPLTYVSFQRFTRTTPPGAPAPALLPN